MKRIPKAIYQTADELDARIKAREDEAARLLPGAAKQALVKEIAQLRMYVEAKRWTESPGLKSKV